jgi:hypothetical protein
VVGETPASSATSVRVTRRALMWLVRRDSLTGSSLHWVCRRAHEEKAGMAAFPFRCLTLFRTRGMLLLIRFSL